MNSPLQDIPSREVIFNQILRFDDTGRIIVDRENRMSAGVGDGHNPATSAYLNASCSRLVSGLIAAGLAGLT